MRRCAHTPALSGGCRSYLVAGEGFTAGENAGVRPGCRGFCRGPGLRTFRPLRGPFKSFPITVKKNETPESEPSTFGS
jgi:hypothetical protein